MVLMAGRVAFRRPASPGNRGVTFTQNLLLARLSDTDLGLLEPHLFRVSLPLGKILCEPDQDIAQIYFPFRGVVSMVNVLEDGSEVECCTLGAETAFGLAAAMEPARSFTRDIAQFGGQGAFISARDMRRACHQSESLQNLVRRHLRAVTGFMAQSVACNARHKLEARLCRWLLTCADYAEGDELPLTQEFIAAMLGVQRTTVTLAAAGLQQDRLIRMVRGKVTILDAEGLKRRSCECYATVRRRIDAALGSPVSRTALTSPKQLAGSRG